MKKNFHEEFYSLAKYYDIAFDFKDVPKECDFMSESFQRFSEKKITSFIEFAAGPALHGLEFARRGVRAAAVDLSVEMCEYGKAKASAENLELEYHCGDMVTFATNEKFDVAAILMDSVSYLTTNEQVTQHLQTVAEHLNPKGLYILEMGHPRSVFQLAASTVNEWEMQKDSAHVKMRWGSDDDVFDPLTQITDTSVRLEYQDSERSGVVENKAPQRCFTATEWEALVQASGRFRIAARFGAMDSAVSFSNDKKAWRMVVVLQKL
ncbi:class I SAM-dependent methyltransferase [Bdellovibrio sp. HCB337]|uniref:class I SAM-dependent methyltransferase n=1 Tax=Bdellovibrio sp. HCB337 TaxID=3394358 RepID=UPI0039A76E2B